ncbi:hypothetical protein D3C80_1555600 [compost metagenome]
MDPGQRRFALGLADFSFADLALQALIHDGHATGQGRLGDIDQDDAQAGRGADLDNAAAHGTGTYHADSIQTHVELRGAKSISQSSTECHREWPTLEGGMWR